MIVITSKQVQPLPRGHPTETMDNPHKPRKMKWTSEEDTLLKLAVTKNDGRGWQKIAEAIPGRNHMQCLQRWKWVLSPKARALKKGRWTKQEDAELIAAMVNFKDWKVVADSVQRRTAIQCRNRWNDHLDPTLIQGPFTPDEDQQLKALYASLRSS